MCGLRRGGVQGYERLVEGVSPGDVIESVDDTSCHGVSQVLLAPTLRKSTSVIANNIICDCFPVTAFALVAKHGLTLVVPRPEGARKPRYRARRVNVQASRSRGMRCWSGAVTCPVAITPDTSDHRA